MSRIALAVLLTLAACADERLVTTTTIAAPTTGAPPTTEPPHLEIADCTTPPVTFSAMCEVYDLLQEWHVDRPLDPSDLAVMATDALRTTESAGHLSGFLQCAIPDPAFADFCTTLGEVGGETAADQGRLVDAALVAMVENALGPFTYYVPPGEVPHVRDDGVVGGIGVILDARDAAGSRCARLAPECPLEIIYVLADAPAAEAGVEVGDVIVEMDGAAVEDLGFAAASRLLAGDETGTISLTIDRGGSSLDIIIHREPVTGGVVEVALPLADVGYLRIPDFSEDIPGLVHEGLTALAEHSPDLVMIDLRDNGGGLLDAAIEVASEFIPDGAVVQLVSPEGEIVEVAGPDGLAHQPALIVLVNRGTASAAEVVAGALRDRRGATIVGEATFGKDSVQIPFDLRNGGRLYVVVARWTTPEGHTVAEDGLSPDIELDLGTNLTIEDLTGLVLEAAG
jgi:carboxyl-terminal processing protease